MTTGCVVAGTVMWREPNQAASVSIITSLQFLHSFH